MDVDVAMSETSTADSFFDFPLPYHTRLASSVSTDSSDSYTSEYAGNHPSRTSSKQLFSPSVHGVFILASYPAFDLYPASDSASTSTTDEPTALNGRLYAGLGCQHLR